MPKPILVFDSGIGGLTILEEIKQVLPDERYMYLFDNARLPYGELSEQTLIDGCVSLITHFIQLNPVSMVVIACNTASTLILPALRAELDIPIVGVVPAVKPAAVLSKRKHIGLLATPGTIKRTYTHELITQFADNCKVELYGSSELVLLAEQKAAGQQVSKDQIARILNPLLDSEIDTLVLGCTHFPILRDEMQAYLGEAVTLVDSGKAIAARVVNLIEQQAYIVQKEISGINELSEATKNTAFYTSDSIGAGLKTTLISFGLTVISKVNQ